MRKRQKVTVGLAVGLALAVAPAQPAYASDIFRSGGGVYFNDSSGIDFFYSSIIASRYRTATEFSRTNTYETTDMNTVVVTSYNSNVDLYVSNGDTSGLGAFYRCTNVLSGSVCNGAQIVYNASGNYTPDYNNYMACHEIGHSVGFQHGTSRGTHACMVDRSGIQFLGSHNAADINNFY